MYCGVVYVVLCISCEHLYCFCFVHIISMSDVCKASEPRDIKEILDEYIGVHSI